MSILELQEQLQTKEDAVLKSILISHIGEHFQKEKVERIFPILNRNGSYTLLYDKKKLGNVSYNLDGEEIIIKFDPTNY